MAVTVAVAAVTMPRMAVYVSSASPNMHVARAQMGVVMMVTASVRHVAVGMLMPMIHRIPIALRGTRTREVERIILGTSNIAMKTVINYRIHSG
ncbi:hypothetical protein [Streptomyces sp. TRM75563]|uniref:hypothetical protein n=1 Tax=Streptomyces sp. TRM75563 TaxID=2817418 RepID=UPI001F60EB58|nr:hypothetical protein [Streptomyces sp. TRM75563]MCI4042151.1 hypothetical protein [Streptomyces sp. TRM75563]